MKIINDEINENWQQSAHENFYIAIYTPDNGDAQGHHCGEISISFDLYSLHEPIENSLGFILAGNQVSVSFTVHLYQKDNVFIFNDDDDAPQFLLSVEWFTVGDEQKLISYQDSVSKFNKKQYEDFYHFILSNIESSIQEGFKHRADIRIEPDDFVKLSETIHQDMEMVLNALKETKTPNRSNIKFFRSYSESNYIQEISDTIHSETIKFNAYQLKNKMNETIATQKTDIFKKI